MLLVVVEVVVLLLGDIQEGAIYYLDHSGEIKTVELLI